MKRLFSYFVLLFTFLCIGLHAEERITVSANSEDISQSLDLHVVAKLFAEAETTEDFENLLNNPDSAFSNLDLNGDGEIDYLRVVETGSTDNRLIVIQSVLAKDIYQDVASIYVERDKDNNVSVQIIGDEYVYGTNYIIEPVYIYRPVIYTWFWSSIWHPWYSPWYWNYYPHWWYHRHCYSYHWYWDRCHRFHHHHHHCSFHHGHHPHAGYTTMHSGVSHREYAERHPEHSFERRTTGVTNARDIHRGGTSVRSSVVREPNSTVRSRTYDSKGSVSTRSSSTRSTQTTTQRTQSTRTTSTQPTRTTSTVTRQPSQSTRTSSPTPTRSSGGSVRSSGSTPVRSSGGSSRRR